MEAFWKWLEGALPSHPTTLCLECQKIPKSIDHDQKLRQQITGVGLDWLDKALSKESSYIKNRPDQKAWNNLHSLVESWSE